MTIDTAEMATANNLTDDQIRDLREVSRKTGDEYQVAICNAALYCANGATYAVTRIEAMSRRDARAACAAAINARAKATAPSPPHPAFIANICGTLIEHPEHDGVTRVFAACPICARAKAGAM